METFNRLFDFLSIRKKWLRVLIGFAIAAVVMVTFVIILNTPMNMENPKEAFIHYFAIFMLISTPIEFIIYLMHDQLLMPPTIVAYLLNAIEFIFLFTNFVVRIVAFAVVGLYPFIDSLKSSASIGDIFLVALFGMYVLDWPVRLILLNIVPDEKCGYIIPMSYLLTYLGSFLICLLGFIHPFFMFWVLIVAFALLTIFLFWTIGFVDLFQFESGAMMSRGQVDYPEFEYKELMEKLCQRYSFHPVVARDRFNAEIITAEIEYVAKMNNNNHDVKFTAHIRYYCDIYHDCNYDTQQRLKSYCSTFELGYLMNYHKQIKAEIKEEIEQYLQSIKKPNSPHSLTMGYVVVENIAGV